MEPISRHLRKANVRDPAEDGGPWDQTPIPLGSEEGQRGQAAACKQRRRRPSSSGSSFTVPAGRAARKCGSRAIESREANGYIASLTLPNADSKPSSAQQTSKSSNLLDHSDNCSTKDIGLRLLAQPPIPTVIPLLRQATDLILKTLINLLTTGLSLLSETTHARCRWIAGPIVVFRLIPRCHNMPVGTDLRHPSQFESANRLLMNPANKADHLTRWKDSSADRHRDEGGTGHHGALAANA